MHTPAALRNLPCSAWADLRARCRNLEQLLGLPDSGAMPLRPPARPCRVGEDPELAQRPQADFPECEQLAPHIPEHGRVAVWGLSRV